MGARTLRSLKLLQFFFRGITFVCSLVVLAIYSYFLASLRSHNLHIPTWARAVEGLGGSAALYSLIGLVLLWCLAGHIVPSIIALILDLAFIGAFIYIAHANRSGAGSCHGPNIQTPFGTAPAGTTTQPNGNGAEIVVPDYSTQCRLETACLAVSIIAIFFLIFSFITELFIIRNHRSEKKYGPGPNNNYTSGSGRRRLGLFGARGRRGRDAAAAEGGYADPNALPAHTEPQDMRQSYATDTTAATTGLHSGHDTAPLHNGAKPGAVYGNPPTNYGNTTYGNTTNPPSNYGNTTYGNTKYGNPQPNF